MDATGIDRVIDSCGELERALEAGPTAWDQPHYHQRLMLVTRHRLDEYPHNAGPIPQASARLLAANNAEFANSRASTTATAWSSSRSPRRSAPRRSSC